MYDFHRPVLLKESIAALNIQPGGIYVDLTFGGGGHSREILDVLEGGQLWAFDQDPASADKAAALQDERLFFVQGNFRFFTAFLHAHGIKQISGILADLGVSSHQLDRAERGFAARLDSGPLDMRMPQAGELTAAKILNTYRLPALVSIFSRYGDVRNARKLAQCLVTAREKNPLVAVGDLKKIIGPLVPKRRAYQYYAKVFQALRIAVNDECNALHDMLAQVPDILAPGGRLVVISYHSGEDRPVKNFIKTGNVAGEVVQDFYGGLMRPLEPLHKKIIVPTEEEISHNNRARSARMRVAERPIHRNV